MQTLKTLILSKSHNISRLITSGLHTTRTCCKAEDRKEMLASMPAKDEGTEGERTISMDQLIQK